MFIVSGIFKLFGDLCGLIGPLSISYIVEFISLQQLNANRSNSNSELTSGAIDTISHGMSATNDYSSSNTSNLNNVTSSGSDDVMLMINYPNWMDFIGNGWIMSYIVLVSFLLQGTFSQASTHVVNMEGIKIKNALQGLIYRKILSLSGFSCCHSSSTATMTSLNLKGECNSDADRRKGGKLEEAEGDADDTNNSPGTITNLMSEDSLNVMSFFWICHYVWSIPLKVSSFANDRDFRGGNVKTLGRRLTFILF